MTWHRATLVLIGIAVPAGLAAQPPVKRIPRTIVRGPLTPGPTQVHGTDLTFTRLDLSPNDRVRYTLVNHGDTPITVPFVVDVYIDNSRVDTYKHASLGAGAAATVVDPVAAVNGCAAVVLKVVADAQQVVTEPSEADNIRTSQVTPPCPDLAITAIKQDWEDFNTRFRIQVTVQNQGNLAMPKTVIARAWGGPDGDLSSTVDPGAWPILTDNEVPVLSPGQSTTFHVGGKYLGTDHVYVKVYLDFFHAIQEKRTDNNLSTKQFGPH